jgi:hypothetical protein
MVGSEQMDFYHPELKVLGFAMLVEARRVSYR